MKFAYFLLCVSVPAFSFQIQCDPKADSGKESRYTIASGRGKSLKVTRELDGEAQTVEVLKEASEEIPATLPLLASSRLKMGSFLFLQPLKSSAGSLGYILVKTDFLNSVPRVSELKMVFPMTSAEDLQTDESDGSYRCTLSGFKAK